MTRLAAVLLASISIIALSSCSDPEGDANALFVEVANELRTSEKLTGIAEYHQLTATSEKLARLTTPEFSRTAVAVKVVSGDKVGPLSLDELRNRLAALEQTPEVCASLRTMECARSLVQATRLEVSTDPERFGLMVEVALLSRLAGDHKLAGEISKMKPPKGTGQKLTLDFAATAALGRVAEAAFPRLDAKQIVEFVNDLNAEFAPVLDNTFTIYPLTDGLRLVQDPQTMTAVLGAWPEDTRAAAANSLILKARDLPAGERAAIRDEILKHLVLPEHRKGALSIYALGGNEQYAEALDLAMDEGERLYIERAVFNSKKADMSAPQKLMSLNVLSKGDLTGLVSEYLRLAVENRKESALSADAVERAGQLASTMASTSDDVDLFRVVRALLDGTIKPEGLVSSANEATRFDIVRMCSHYPWYLRTLERSDLIPELATACRRWLVSNTINISDRREALSVLVAEAAQSSEVIYQDVLSRLGNGLVAEHYTRIVSKLIEDGATTNAQTLLRGFPDIQPEDKRSGYGMLLSKTALTSDKTFLEIWDEAFREVGYVSLPTLGFVQAGSGELRSFAVTQRPKDVATSFTADVTSDNLLGSVSGLDSTQLRAILPYLEGRARTQAIQLIIWMSPKPLSIDVQDLVWAISNDPLLAAAQLGAYLAANKVSKVNNKAL